MYDCVVVGGRVAGAATAIHLARLGHSVALVDRDHHPSPTLSTHVFGDWEAFAPLGVTPRLLAAGAPRLTRFRTDVEGCVTEADMLATPYVLGLRRERLDPILIEAARAEPAVDWYEGCTAEELLPGTPRPGGDGDLPGDLPGGLPGGLPGDPAVGGVVVRTPTGRRTRLAARLTVGADGRNSFVARTVRAAPYLTRPRQRCAYYGYLSGVAGLPVPAFEYLWRGDDIVLVIPCDGGLTCVCVMPPQEEFGRWRAAREELYDARLRDLPGLTPRLAGARREGRVLGSGSLASYLRTCAGPGWALVGDAGAAVHPCIGAGIDHAAVCAGLLARAAHGWLTGETGWRAAFDGYRTARDARVGPTLEAAVRLAARGGVPAGSVLWLRALMTMPGTGHDLATGAAGVVRHLRGAGGAAALAALLGLPAAGDTSGPGIGPGIREVAS